MILHGDRPLFPPAFKAQYPEGGKDDSPRGHRSADIDLGHQLLRSTPSIYEAEEELDGRVFEDDLLAEIAK